MRGLITSFARNIVFANILLLFIFFGGGLAIMNMARETFPDIQLDIIRIAVLWPGADPEEVEEGICRKIEEALDGLDGVKEYHTVSTEHAGMALVEVMDGRDVNQVKELVRGAINAISTFPPSAERPLVEQLVLRIQVMMLALTGDELSDVELREYAERIKDEVRALPEVTQAQVMSARPHEIAIEVSEDRLREYGFSFEQITQTIRANSLNLPGGTLRSRGEEIRLRTLGKNYTAAEFAELIAFARPDGASIPLDRIATIHDGLAEQTSAMRFNGRNTAIIRVLKTREEDTLVIDRAVRDYVARKQAELPENVSLDIWARRAPPLEARISLLLRNGLLGLVMVFIMLWLFLDIRLSFWAGMGMPVSIMGAFMCMWYFGATINMMSLFAMITVLGIIVDDAIVVGEAIYVARRNGAPPLRAAVDGVLEVGMPVIAAVTTSIVAFLPLFFVYGVMGRLIVVLPLVVVSALAVSLVECLFLLPAHLSHLPDPNTPLRGKSPFLRLGLRFHHMTNHGLERFVERWYSPFIALAIRWRYVSFSIAVFVMLITWGTLESGAIKFENFPRLDGNTMTATVEFPSGTPLEATEAAVVRLEEALRELADNTQTKSGAPLVENMFSLVGARIDDQGGMASGSHLGSVRVEMLNTVDRDIHIEELTARWERHIGMITGALALTVRGGESGPSGNPIEVWMQGDNLDSLVAAANDLKAKLAEFEGVFQIQDDFRRGQNEIRLRLKPEARALGLHAADLARQLYTGYQGEEVMRVQRGRNDVRVRVRYPEDERTRLSAFENIRIRPSMAMAPPSSQSKTTTGIPRPVEVPLSAVANIEYTSGAADIRRTNGQRRLMVTADVDTDVANANDIVGHLRAEYFPDLQNRYRDTHMSFKGAQQDFRDAVDSLYISFPLAIIGIFIIIAAVFRSYVQPLLILVTVPFGMSGAVFGHLVLGHNLTMLSIFGLVALAGVVVNDAIVLIECVNNYIADGESFHEAVRRGGARRFRAIILTTITTVGGLAPLIMERDRQAQPLIPMAISLASGISFATLLTLLLLPCLFCILNDLRRATHYLLKGEMPSPEDVEPARLRKLDRE